MNKTRLALWVAAAVAAVGVSTAAVTVANAESGGDDVLSQDEVARQLADETASPGTTPSEEPPPTGDGESTKVNDPLRNLHLTYSQAGYLVVECDGDQTYLESWSPKPGYRVDDMVEP